MKRVMTGTVILALACGAAAIAGAGCSGKSSNGGSGSPTPSPTQTNTAGGVHYEFSDAGFSEPHGEEYRCWYVDVPTGGASDGDVGATQFSYTSTSGVLHHMVVFSSTDTSQINGSNAPCQLFEGSWTIRFAGGKQTGPLVMPAGVAIPMRKTERFVIQLHLLNAGDAAVVDNTKVDVDFTKSGTSFTKAGLMYSGSSSFSIPATSAPYPVDGSCVLPGGTPAVTIFAIWPHMHQIGTHFHIDLQHASTDTTLLDWVWNFNDQPMYQPSNGGVSVTGGDTINTECTYVNADPGGNAVDWGESSTQEMCYDFFYYYPSLANQSIPCGL